ncbi:MAG: CotH kinase family protein [Coriobacteriales bacterium]|jgi:hypothetical protein
MRKAIPVLLISLMTVMFAVGCSGSVSTSNDAGSYADLLFDTSRVHTIEVSMSDGDRADQLANPTDKTKYEADVTVDGETIEDVSFQAKGNSSLFFMVDVGRDKYSYAINFGKHVEGQTFHGLDKMNLQNNFVDGSAMKEYMTYWLFRKMGVDAPLASFAWLTVNGEDQGLYTALEDVDDSFLERTTAGEGTLYKPEGSSMALSDEEMERIKAGNSASHDSAFGTFPPEAKSFTDIDGIAVINAGIDSPLGGTVNEDRPMWRWILSDERYLDEYHDVLSELVAIIDSGEFEAESGRVSELILPYIEKDPKAVFTAEEAAKAQATINEITKLRAESVRRQLSGELASKTDLQEAGDKVDASGISIADMGTLASL